MIVLPYMERGPDISSPEDDAEAWLLVLYHSESVLCIDIPLETASSLWLLEAEKVWLTSVVFQPGEEAFRLPREIESIVKQSIAIDR